MVEETGLERIYFKFNIDSMTTYQRDVIQVYLSERYFCKCGPFWMSRLCLSQDRWGFVYLRHTSVLCKVLEPIFCLVLQSKMTSLIFLLSAILLKLQQCISYYEVNKYMNFEVKFSKVSHSFGSPDWCFYIKVLLLFMIYFF